jgi:hypothetical protein
VASVPEAAQRIIGGASKVVLRGTLNPGSLKYVAFIFHLQFAWIPIG